MESNEKVVILGGGISGLVSGIFSLKNGYKTAIYEKNSNVGGIALALYDKKNNLNNFSYFPIGKINGDVNNFWKELGLEFQIIESEYLIKYHDIYVYKDLIKLTKELNDKSIEDKKMINDLIQNIETGKKSLLNVNKPLDLMNVLEQTKLGFSQASTIRLINKYSNIDISSYFSKFKNEEIRNTFLNIIPSYYPVYLLFMILGSYVNGGIAKIKNSIYDIINSLKETYINLGGEIFYNRTAISIDSYRGVSQGVWFENKFYVNCHHIICAIDNHYTYDTLLQKKYSDRKFVLKNEDYKNYPITSIISLNYSIKEDLSNISDVTILDINKTKIATTIIDKIKLIKNNNFLTVNILLNNNDYQYFNVLFNNKGLYNKELSNINENIMNEINKYLFTIYNKNVKLSLIEYITPLSIKDTYNSYLGSIYSFALTKDGKLLNHNTRITGISNIYLAGQWSGVIGGMLLSSINSKFAVNRLVYDKKLLFNKIKKNKDK